MNKLKKFLILGIIILFTGCTVSGSRGKESFVKINQKIHPKYSADINFSIHDDDLKKINSNHLFSKAAGEKIYVDEESNSIYIYHSPLIKYSIGKKPEIIKDFSVDTMKVKNGKLYYFTNEGFVEENVYRSTFYSEDTNDKIFFNSHVRDFEILDNGDMLIYQQVYLSEKDIVKSIQRWNKKDGTLTTVDSVKRLGAEYFFLKSEPFKYKYDDNSTLIKDVLNNRQYTVYIGNEKLLLNDFIITPYEYKGKEYLALTNLYDNPDNIKKNGLYTYETVGDKFVLSPFIMEDTSQIIAFYNDCVSFDGKLYDLKTKKIIKEVKEENVFSLLKLN